MEKVFLTEIDSLDRQQGCFASNQYFARFFGLKITRTSQIINSLIKKGFIDAKYERKGREIVKRVLTIKCKKVFNILYEGIQKSVRRYPEKCKDNNTTNNTINKYYTDEMKEIFNYWNTWENNLILQTHFEKTIKNKINKKHAEIIKIIGLKEIKKAINNYAYILNYPDKYWFTYKFTFWRFLEKIDTFLDSADPLNNYKNKDNKQQITDAYTVIK